MRNNVTRSLRIAEKINDWPSSRKSIIAKANRGPRVPIHWADGCRTVENRVVLTCCVLVRVRGDDNTQREGKKGEGKRRNAVYARGQETNELPRSFLSLPIPELHKLKAKLSTLGDARSAGACVGAKKTCWQKSLFVISIVGSFKYARPRGWRGRFKENRRRARNVNHERQKDEARRRVGKEGWTRNGLAVPDCPPPLPLRRRV